MESVIGSIGKMLSGNCWVIVTEIITAIVAMNNILDSAVKRYMYMRLETRGYSNETIEQQTQKRNIPSTLSIQKRLSNRANPDQTAHK